MTKANSTTTSLAPNDLRGMSSATFFLLMVLLAILFIPFSGRGQEKDHLVKGIVTDSDGNAIFGASVNIKGTKTGTVTNEKGEFLLAATPRSILVFTHLNYKRQEIAPGNRRQLEVTMESSVSNMNEVMVVGYGKLKKSDMSGAISTLKIDRIENKAVSLPEALQGRVAGVQIITNTGEPGSGITFNIRGKTSVTGSNQPLIVLDGQPIESGLGTTMAGIAVDGGAEIPPADPLAGINPNDIASIEILKDASSTAIYGSRGANGVVLITTKSGKAGRDKVTYSNRFDVGRLPKKIKMLSSMDYAHFRNEAYLNEGGDSTELGTAAGTYSLAQIDSLGTTKNVNWQDEIYRSALSQDHQITISGRDAKNRYLVSGNYSDQQSIVRKAAFQRYGLRVNYQREVSKKLTVGVHSYLSLANRIYGQQSNWTGILGSSAVMGALAFNPLRTAYEPDGTLDEEFANNPLLVTELVKDKTQIRTILVNLSVDYKITKDLTYQLKGAVNDLYSLRNLYYPTGTFIGNTAPGGSATRADQTNSNALLDNILTFNKVFAKKHSVNWVAGFSYQAWKTAQTSVTSMDFPSNALEYYNFAAASAPGRFYNPEKTRALASVISRLNYTYDRRYILTLTGRYDGATRLADGNKWQLFPSVGVGWNVSNEKFFDNLSKSVSLFKIRASYGIAGNENIAIGATQASYGINYVVIGGSIQPGYVVGDFANGTLGWETTRQLNVGTDLGFLKDRITVTADVYKKTTTDLLINLSLPGSAGYANYYTNVGKVENRGLDLEVSADILRGKLKWDVSGNFSIFDNKVLNMGASDIVYGRTYLAGGAVLLGQPLQVAKVGYPVSSFWGYKTNGVYQNEDEVSKGPEASTAKPGDVKWVDVSGDGQITDADKTIIGNPNPDFTYGFNMGFSYKGFSLNMSVFGSHGNELLNINRWIVGGGSTNGNYNLMQDRWDGRWHGEGTSNLYPKVTTNPVRLNQRFPDWMVEDASFIRLQSLTLAYNFTMPRRSPLSALRVFASGTNLITITKYTGYDPNVNSFGHNSLNSGVDFGTLPQPRTVSAGLEVSF
ncbi:TonB-dependent receptor [Chitinophaga sp.]|uniref:SusC/RagA family TonB-linked outer membrane protein n=1 Tax=Chitinophaga sp. TaxID=1869181 RepID=UPI0031E2EC6E